MTCNFLQRDATAPIKNDDIPLVFLPGWGFDARIVGLYSLFTDHNVIAPDGFVTPGCAGKDLLSFIDQQGIGKVKIIGWSMGANIGLDFTCRHAERVHSLDLFSMRRSWPGKDINAIRQGLSESVQGFMADFYRKCFLGYRREYNIFKEQLQDNYLGQLDIDTLLMGLKYLQDFVLPDEAPQGVKVQLIHGAKDIIAPVKERVEFTGAEALIEPSGGHAVFFDYCARHKDK